MVSDAPERVAVGTEPQGLEAEPARVAAAGAEAVAGTPAGTVAESQAFDLATLDGIKKAAELNPLLRQWREEGYGAGVEAGRQRARADLEREAASSEKAAEFTQSLIDRLNAGEDPQVIRRDAPKFITANAEWARAQVLRGLAEQTLELVPEERRADLKSDLDDAVSAADIEKVTARSLEALQRHFQDSLDFDALYEAQPKFKEYVDSRAEAKVQQEVETELTAQRVEQNARTVAPNTPVGTQAASETDLIEQIVNMPQAEQIRFLSDMALKEPERFKSVSDALYAAGRA